MVHSGGKPDNKEARMKTARECHECRDGEHDNYDDLVLMTVVRDQETGKIVGRGYLCREHRDMHEEDGHDVTTR